MKEKEKTKVVTGIVLPLVISISQRQLDGRFVWRLATEFSDAFLDGCIDGGVDFSDGFLILFWDDQADAVFGIASIDGFWLPDIGKGESYDAYQGCYFLNANSKTPPQIVDRRVKPILDQSEVYSGCFAKVSISFYAFNTNGNKGVACGLGNIQKVKDGEPLSGRSNASDDFTSDFDDDFLA